MTAVCITCNVYTSVGFEIKYIEYNSYMYSTYSMTRHVKFHSFFNHILKDKSLSLLSVSHLDWNEIEMCSVHDPMA